MIKRSVSVFIAAVLLLLMLPVSHPARAVTGGKLIALTFDDGPGPYTDRLLDGLKVKGVKATFFTPGTRAQMYPAQIKRIFSEGHQLANHAYDHAELTSLSVSAAVGQVTNTNAILNGYVGGSENYLLRFPYGSASGAIRSQLPCPDLMWSVDTLDWMYRDAGYVCSKLISSAYDGAVVLMHDIHSTTVTGVLNAIDALKAQGYEMVTVRELFRRRGVTMNNGVSYNQCAPNGKDAGPAPVPKVTVEAAEGGALVTFSPPPAGAKLYYTLDGSAIGYNSKEYTGPFVVSASCTIRAVTAYHLNGGRSDELVYSYTLPPAHMAVLTIENGMLSFSGVPEAEKVLYILDRFPLMEETVYKEPVPIERDTVLTYRTVGEGKAPTAAKRLYYSPLGNLLADVPQGVWYTDAMDRAVSMELLSGVGEYQYKPMDIVNRAMLCQILYSSEGRPEAFSDGTFTDLKDGAWYVDAVLWAEGTGIVSGYGDGRFGPEDPITREQLAAILWRHSGEPESEEDLSEFTDGESVSRYARDAMAWAVERGVVSGKGKGLLDPAGKATRCEAVSMVIRYIEQQ